MPDNAGITSTAGQEWAAGPMEGASDGKLRVFFLQPAGIFLDGSC